MKTIMSRQEAIPEETQVRHLLAHLECGFRTITEPQRALLIKLLREQQNKADCGVEKLESHLAHNQELAGSSPAPATT